MSNQALTIPAHLHVQALEDEVTAQALEIIRLRAVIATLMAEPGDDQDL